MLSVRACSSLILITALAAVPAFASRTHRAPTSGHHHRIFKKHHHVVKGQRGIDSDRAREIQSALIREKYLSGSPSGQWDAQTETAMQRYQADHGWQTKMTPDSRALIMLGLGPNHSEGTAAAETPPAAPNPGPAANTLASTHVIQN